MKVQSIEPVDEKVKLLFEISDTGIGIPENRLHVLFKAFRYSIDFFNLVVKLMLL